MAAKGDELKKQEALIYADYFEMLSGADEDIIREASHALVKSRQFTCWPTVGECYQAIQKTAERMAADRKTAQMARPQLTHSPAPKSAETKAMVNSLVKHFTSEQRELDKCRQEAMSQRESAKLDWSRISKPAWEERLRTSVTAQFLAMGLRSDGTPRE